MELSLIDDRKLLITIVEKGLGSKVIEVSKTCGCEGGTIIPGQGTSGKSASSFWGLTFDPERDVVFSLIEKDKVRTVMDTISENLDLNEPNKGISFIVNVQAAAGISHLINH